MLAVLLATVLAPSFGWELSAAQTAQGHDVLALGDAHAGDGHDHQGGDTDSGSMDSHHHHGCAGHMFGHLFAVLCNEAAPAFLYPGELISAGRQRDFITPFPKRLDRPPHASNLA